MKILPRYFPFCVVVALSIARVAVAAPSIAPNFLLILTDDQGWSQMSVPADPRLPASRSEYLQTPNLERLARAGVRFTSGYSPAPLCTPTRRSILCGTSAARSGTEFKSAWVPAEHLTLPRALKRANPAYRCAHFGKWGEDMNATPEQSGYDVSDGLTGNGTGGMPSSLGVEDHTSGPAHFIDDEDPKRTASMTTRAIAFMREQVKAGRPFYAQASYYAVHLSVVTRAATLEKYRRKGAPDRGYSEAWAAMLDELDAGVGRLLDSLEEMGVADNTYVIFTSDNGGRGTVPGGDPARLPPNHPLTGAKHSLNEGGIRVPFIARGPGLPGGAHCVQPVAGYDLLPTFYDLAGGREPLPSEVDGASLRPLFRDPSTTHFSRPHDALFFHRPAQKVSAIRQGEHKLMVTWNADGSVASRALYRIDADPREEGRDIAARNTAVADRLQALLQAHLLAVNAEKPAPAGGKGAGKGGKGGKAKAGAK